MNDTLNIISTAQTVSDTLASGAFDSVADIGAVGNVYVPYFDSVMQTKMLSDTATVADVLPVLTRVDAWEYQPIVGVGFLVCLLLYIIAVIRTKGSIGRSLGDLFASKQRRREYQAETQDSFLGKMIYWVLSILGYTLYIVLDFGSSDWLNETIGWHELAVFGAIAGGVALALWLKGGVMSLIGYIFHIETAMYDYRKFVFSLLMLLGQVCLIVCFGQIFLPITMFYPLKIVVVCACVIAQCMSIYKAFQFFYIRFLSCYYLFLYFCTLNFIPLMVLKKAAFEWLGIV
ncbi:MAG: DUF4271 domain-containing protein [Bacteroidales bacterium]|nr:DUF4271 domain-containing protein [Bacteroidales bacterium]